MTWILQRTVRAYISAAIRFIPYYSIFYQEQKTIKCSVMQIDSCLARAIATAQKKVIYTFHI